MLVLGIESTCDETGCALVRNGSEILSNVVATQEEVHQKYGGVIPELACRRHIDVFPTLLHKALCVDRDEIDLIAVARGPGLIGALLIGLNFAKALSFSLNKPIVGVNHIEAHIYASFMTHTIPLPAIGVIISGGHTALVKVEGIWQMTLIGQTQDDAIGEAFDKVAKLLKLPYPGGPHIEILSKQGNPYRFSFKAGQMKDRPFDFSYSGLKTAVLYLVKGQNAAKDSPLLISEEDKADVAASFQHCAFSVLVEKTLAAAKQYQCRSIILGGGVSQNCYLQSLMEKHSHLPVFWPAKGLCLDNAAMIAGLGFHNFLQNGCDSMTMHAQARIPLKESFHADSTDSTLLLKSN